MALGGRFVPTLAQFYAGANKTRDLTEEDVLRQETLDYVAAVQQTALYYGEGEWSVIQRLFYHLFSL
jgi:hypothetical protein